MINLHAIKSYFNFYFSSDTYYRIHSPFLFDLLNNTLEDDRHYYIFDRIEELRKELLRDNTLLNIEDLGAGSKITTSNQRSVKDITNSAVSPAYQSKFLFKLMQYLKAKKVIELGTSMGISSLYLSAYSKDIRFITLEGSKSILTKAQQTFNAYGNTNIKTILGHFDNTLPQALKQIGNLDACYIDGNHAKEPTLKYFEWCLPYTHHGSVLIFDDIYWSTGMTEAWEEIKNHEEVTLSLDLYYFGLVFFNPNFKEKQSFKVIDSRIKFWQRYI